MSPPFSQRTLVHVLRHRASERGDQPWLIFEDRVVSYREADRLSDRLARGMEANGLTAGDTLLTMLPDSLDLVLAWLACAKLGVIEVPVNTAYRGDILAHVIKDSRARTMLIGARWLERLTALGSDFAELPRCFVRHEAGEAPVAETPDIRDLETLYDRDDRPIQREIRPSDLKAVMYTSGTTGHSSFRRKLGSEAGMVYRYGLGSKTPGACHLADKTGSACRHRRTEVSHVEVFPSRPRDRFRPRSGALRRRQ